MKRTALLLAMIVFAAAVTSPALAARLSEGEKQEGRALTGQNIRSHFTSVETAYRKMRSLDGDTVTETFFYRRDPRFVGRYINRGPDRLNYIYLYTPNRFYQQDDDKQTSRPLASGRERLAVLGQFFPEAFVYAGISGPVGVEFVQGDTTAWVFPTKVTAFRLKQSQKSWDVTGFKRSGALYEVMDYREDKPMPDRFDTLIEKHINSERVGTPF